MQITALDRGAVGYAFITAINQLITSKNDYIIEYESIVAELTDTASIEREIEKLQSKSIATYSALKAVMEENAHRPLNQ
ncbi:MAG: hypothetical protein ACRCZK_01360 [Oscillospiraceae bacterium]